MSKYNLLSLLVVWLGLVSQSISAQSVKIASWTIDTGYDVSGDTYTPNSNAWADADYVWFSSQTPVLLANEAVGNVADYKMTALSKGRYWQLCTGYNNQVFRIENAEANAITDYTNASNHNAYYEVSFPTKGYKDISLEFACAYGGGAEATLQMVVSTDGGTTWFDGGAFKTAPNWWIYNVNTATLSANNKDNVIVRLIAGNGFASNWNLDYLHVYGEKISVAEPIDVEGATIAWPFDEGAEVSSSAVCSVDNALSASSWELGTKLVVKATGAAGTETLTKLEPTEKANSQDASAYVKYTIIPKKGVNITPKKLTFNAARFGTNGGNIDVYVNRGSESVQIVSALNPCRPGDNNNETPEYTAAEYDITSMTASSDRIEILFYVWKLDVGKQVGLSDVTLICDIEGTPEAVPVYSLSTKLGDDGAGQISVSPSGNEFDEGTEVTVSVKENFGYHFVAWTDAEDNTVSTDLTYTFEMKDNTSLTATFEKNNVYALNYSLVDDMENEYSNTNLLVFEPQGNIVDGVHYYEEGTMVKLTAQSNKILSFVGWEDNSTNAERIITVNKEQNVIVNYAVEDYIVGWDFYQDQPNTQRAADYKSNSENAGILSLRTSSGTTTTWLTRGVNNGAENGKWGARIWKLRSDGYYFETSFSTKGYSNIKVSAALGISYNSYKTIQAEYSVDGTNYTAIGKYDMLSNGWTENEFSLPEAANNQDRVYVRWVKASEELVGHESDYDGLCISDIYVVGDSEMATDEQKPQLLSSNPANGSNEASASGSIVLVFDERIKIGTGNATLDGEELPITVTGKSAVFVYNGLEYNKQYTFTLPSGVITDRSGNAYEGTEFKFTTMQRLQPTARLYDAVVAQDGSGDYTTVQAAIDAAPSERGLPWLIFIKNGEYNEHVNVPASKPYLHFIGQDRDKTIIYDDKLCGGDNALHVSVGATVVVNSNNCYFENVTLENSWGHDKQAGPQALALNTAGDRTIFKNVAMLSYQDTWITPSTSSYRAYVTDCFIEGAVDFIYNSGDIYIENTTLYINRKSGGFIVAPSHAEDVKWGYVFNNCTITAPGVPSETDVWLGRPWHNSPKTVFLHTKAEVTIPAAGWYETMGGLPVLWADYMTTDAKGNLLDLSQRRDTYYKTDSEGNKTYGTAKNFLTDAEAAQYTVKNVLSGTDSWQPKLVTEACEAPKVSLKDGYLSWEAVPYAICYVITKDDIVVGFTTETTFAYEAGSQYKIQAANEYGGLSQATLYSEESNAIVDDFNVNDMTIEGIYSLDGKKVRTMQKGVNLIRYIASDGSAKVVKILK